MTNIQEISVPPSAPEKRKRGQQINRKPRGPDKKPRRIVRRGAREFIQKLLNDEGPRALQVLIKIMHDDSASNPERIKCAQEILNRSFGMPTKSIEANVSVDINGEFLDALKAINAKIIDVDAEDIDIIE